MNRLGNERGEATVGYGAMLVLLAALIVYAGALANGFALDDVVLIPGDARVVGGAFGKLLTTTYWNDPSLGLYRPLTSLSFGLDWYASHGSAAWFHLVNLGWHALASLLAYLLLARFFRTGAAIVGGLVFALHPVHVEAVANVVGRAELMSAAFFFAACLIWTTDLSWLSRAVLTALCYLAALLTKESAIVLPGILILLDGALGRVQRDYLRIRWREYVPLGIALLLFVLARLAVVGGFVPARVDPALEVASGIGQRWLTALQVWPLELKLLFFPRTLLADYDPQTLMPLTDWTPMAVVGLTLLLATTIGGVVAFARRSYYWALGLLWFPVTILVVSNLIIPVGVLLAERTLYVPSFVVSFALAAGLSQKLKLPQSQILAVTVVVLALLAVRTATRVPVWKSTDDVMLSVVHQQPNAFRGVWHLARMARSGGHVDEAIRRYDRALKLWPYREGLVQEAAAYATQKGRAAWARDVAFWGTRRWPREIDFHRLLAGNAIDLGDTVLARRAVLEGLQVSPNDTILNQMWRAFGQPRGAQ